MIIGLSGARRAGKNEVGRIIQSLGDGFDQRAFAWKIRELLVQLNPILVPSDILHARRAAEIHDDASLDEQTELWHLERRMRSGVEVLGLAPDCGPAGHKELPGAKAMVLALNPYVTRGETDTLVRDVLPDPRDEVAYEAAKDRYPETRALLQRLGTEAGRVNLSKDVWLRACLDGITGNLVITDCRFTDEAEAIRERGGVVWRIVRPGAAVVNGHASDTDLDDWDGFAAVIVNDGTLKELAVKVETELVRLGVRAER